MKTLFLFLSLFLGFGADKQNWDQELAEMTKQELIAAAHYLNPQEKAMLWEINLVRTDPQAYIPFIQEELVKMRQDSVRLSTMFSESITTREEIVDGVKQVSTDTVRRNFYTDRIQALSELIIQLDRAIPTNALDPSYSLYTAAVKHGDSQSETGYVGHRGLDGSWPFERHLRENLDFIDGNENIVRYKGTPREIVIQLLIDSGVPERGHRHNLLDPQWKYVTCHHVRQLDRNGVQWWIQEFAY